MVFVDSYNIRSEAHRIQHVIAECSLEPPIENSPYHTPHRRYLYGEATWPLSILSSRPGSETGGDVSVRGRPSSDILLVQVRAHLPSLHVHHKCVRGTANATEERPVSEGDMGCSGRSQVINHAPAHATFSHIQSVSCTSAPVPCAVLSFLIMLSSN